jgi:energy-coupling factor transport system ATP-binding protein
MSLVDALHKNGTTIVMITHDMDIVAKYATRTIAMKNGEIVLDGNTREVFSNEQALKETYVTPPQCVLLSQKLKKHGLQEIIMDDQELADAIMAACREDRV